MPYLLRLRPFDLIGTWLGLVWGPNIGSKSAQKLPISEPVERVHFETLFGTPNWSSWRPYLGALFPQILA